MALLPPLLIGSVASKHRFLAASLILAGCAASEPRPADPQLVGQWLRTSLAFVRSERLGPPVAARISAYGSLALY